MTDDEYKDELHRKLKAHGKQVEAKLRRVLAERYDIDDPVEVEIAIKTEKLRYYEVVELPVELVRLRVYAYDNDFLFTDVISNTSGGFTHANAVAKAQVLIKTLIESQNLQVRDGHSNTSLW